MRIFYVSHLFLVSLFLSLLLSGCFNMHASGGYAPLPGADGPSYYFGFRPTAEEGSFGLMSGFEASTFSPSGRPSDSEFNTGFHAALMYHLVGRDVSLYALGGGRFYSEEVYGYEGGLGVDLTLTGDPDTWDWRNDETYVGAFIEGGYGSTAQESTSEWYSSPFVRAGLTFRLGL